VLGVGAARLDPTIGSLKVADYPLRKDGPHAPDRPRRLIVILGKQV
jgi:hypothetical protein